MPSEGSFERIIGQRLRNFRGRLGLTQRELAERVAGGVDLSYIGRIERGEQLPSLKLLQKLGRSLGVPVGEFFGRELDARIGGKELEPLWRALQGVPRKDVPILLGIAKLLARGRRRPTAGKVAAERRSSYRKGRRSRRSPREMTASSANPP
ncbi:MAG: helix-turn-helix domain-containing protein [Candidatus Rokubacteria bacterium]|nr:helix-turn-helix domain-containing protein [Candidatus Rokubacteria bacterium]